MNIDILCEAIFNNLNHLCNHLKRRNLNDHSFVESFQDGLCLYLKKMTKNYKWETEKEIKGRLEKDSIDIFGQSSGNPNWIIEIDATRADQVAKKFLSRLALLGLNNPINYVALLYPDTQDGKKSCEKYLRYAADILKKTSNKSTLVGIFVDPNSTEIEVVEFGKGSDHFLVNGKIICSSMNSAAAAAIKLYIKNRPKIAFSALKENWGKFVASNRGPSRYKDIKIQTKDHISVFTYTQFRQYGFASYWYDFVRLCKKNKINIRKMRKLYNGGVKPPYNPYNYV